MSENHSLSRRSFIGKSLAGLAGAGLAATGGDFAFAQISTPEDKPKELKPITRTLGKTGIVLPIVSMGVMNASIPNIVIQSYEKGIRHFDTAGIYQNGENERMVGNVVKKLGVRDELIISTKNFTPQDRKDLTPEQSRDKVIEILEGSLKRLQMDYVDILYMHDVNNGEEANNPGVNEAFQILKKQGKIRFSGVATHQGQTSVLNAAVKNGYFDVALIAFNVALSGFPELFEAMDRAFDSGMGLIAMKTQSGGMWWKYVFDKEMGAPNQTAMLKWALRHKNIATAIPGHTDPEQLEQNWSVVYDLEYTEEEKKFLDDKEIILGMDYCRQCTKCLATCPNGAEIPDLMRVHMYAAQYRNFHHARYTYDCIPKDRGLGLCRDCSSCKAECAHSVDIAGRIGELKQMYV